jgi:hypothetical protein
MAWNRVRGRILQSLVLFLLTAWGTKGTTLIWPDFLSSYFLRVIAGAAAPYHPHSEEDEKSVPPFGRTSVCSVISCTEMGI